MQDKISECIKLIRSVDYDKLEIRSYNKIYIRKILSHLEYNFSMFQQSLFLFQKQDKESYIVDFGGGHGFLSLFLKMLGYRVIYCDLNPLSVQSVILLKEHLGFGPDHIVTGSSAELRSFCQDQNLCPTFLIATDLIEHVYDLSILFGDLHEINPHFEMVFTTGSNPANIYKCRRLRKVMVQDEKNFTTQRADYIRKEFPSLKEEEIKKIATHTRGKNYPDIKSIAAQYLQNKQLPPLLKDRYNTCDPETSSWTERILSFNDYRQLAGTSGFQLRFYPGFYNEKRENAFLSFLFCRLNVLIRVNKYIGYRMAPYILLHFRS